MTFLGRSVRRRIRMPCFLTTGIMSGKEYRLSEKNMDGGTYTQKADEIILLEEEER